MAGNYQNKISEKLAILYFAAPLFPSPAPLRAAPCDTSTHATMTTSALLPYLGCVLAIASWGSFTVPLKSPSVQSVDLHPLWFQCYVGIGVAFSSLPLLLIRHDAISDFTRYGVISAFMWVLCNASAMAAVKLLGIATAQSTWGALIAIISFLLGIVWGDIPSSLPLSILGIIVLILGIVILAYVSSNSTDSSDSPSTEESATDLDSLLADTSSEVTPPMSATRDRFLGFCCTLLTGMIAGTIFIPLKLAPERYHDGLESIKFSFAQGVGTLPATIAWVPLLFYLLYIFENSGSLCGNKQSFSEWLPPAHFKKCFWPGFLSGLLWNAGNLGATLASLPPLQTVGYTITQSALLVGCAWGVFVFKEIKGTRNVRLFWVGAFVTLAGLCILGWYGKCNEE
jgi:glucose uptake protein GlcU